MAGTTQPTSQAPTITDPGTCRITHIGGHLLPTPILLAPDEELIVSHAVRMEPLAKWSVVVEWDES